MSPRILWFLLSLCLALAALTAQRTWSTKLIPSPLVTSPIENISLAKTPFVKQPNENPAPPTILAPASRQPLPPHGRAATSEGEQWVAGSAATRLKAYMTDFDGEDTAALEQQLEDLEEEVAAADYFARANGGTLSFGETMAFDDLLKRQEAIHLILLQRKLATLGRLTAKL